MLTNSEETGCGWNRNVARNFLTRWLMAREVMVPRTDAFMSRYQDDTQTIIESILNKTFSNSCLWWQGQRDWFDSPESAKSGFYQMVLIMCIEKDITEHSLCTWNYFVDDLLKNWNSKDRWLFFEDTENGWFGNTRGLMKRLLVRLMMRLTVLKSMFILSARSTHIVKG